MLGTALVTGGLTGVVAGIDIALVNQRHDDGAPPTAEVAPIRKIRARGGVEIPALGLGTWKMGEKGSRRKQEIAALRLGFDLAMTMVDTAEMYADGGAEEVVGEAVRGRRDEVFIVTKVLPENASYEGTIKAAERSLRRLGCRSSKPIPRRERVRDERPGRQCRSLDPAERLQRSHRPICTS